MYIGAIMPWSNFQDPNGTGLTYGRLIGLGILVLLLRRIPAIFALYKFMPEVCQDWKEALFMGYFGPIGIGAVFYVEHTRHLFPESGEALTTEENDLTAVMIPVVYWLVLFSIIVHGLSIPALNIFLRWRGVEPICDEKGGVEMDMLSTKSPLPKNSRRSISAGPSRRNSIIVHNRFSRGSIAEQLDWNGSESAKFQRRWPQRRLSSFGGAEHGRSDSQTSLVKEDEDGQDAWVPVRKYVTEPTRAAFAPRPREISFADEADRGRRRHVVDEV